MLDYADLRTIIIALDKYELYCLNQERRSFKAISKENYNTKIKAIKKARKEIENYENFCNKKNIEQNRKNVLRANYGEEQRNGNIPFV